MIILPAHRLLKLLTNNKQYEGTKMKSKSNVQNASSGHCFEGGISGTG